MKASCLSFLLLMGCAPTPNPSSALARKIVQLMDEYLPKRGLTIITGEICDLVSETSLNQAIGELGTLRPETWKAGVGYPQTPLGSLRARFSRDSQFLYNQDLLIYVSDKDQYCEAKIENVFGL